ncbi:MAG: nucleotidyltransferase domain-containing protein [Arcobacteraceae bacterium]|jgi:predicted nucleotidyltransferase|nr:nucleotidyltransferase domain-containing protein [Arcobacteraceae bacterium]
MVNIEELKPLIVEKLKSLNPEQIILFGSYAYGTPNNDSDIDLFITKETIDEHMDAIAIVKLRDLMKHYKIGFDVLVGSSMELSKREDPFYKIDILQRGIKIYG